MHSPSHVHTLVTVGSTEWKKWPGRLGEINRRLEGLVAAMRRSMAELKQISENVRLLALDEA